MTGHILTALLALLIGYCVGWIHAHMQTQREEYMKAAAEMAREAEAIVLEGSDTTVIERLVELVRADKRERIIAANAPEIERCNAYIKELEEAIRARGNP